MKPFKQVFSVRLHVLSSYITAWTCSEAILAGICSLASPVVLLKGNKMLLSLAPILMQTILAPNFLEIFFWQIFFCLMLTKEYVFVLRNFLLLHTLKN